MRRGIRIGDPFNIQKPFSSFDIGRPRRCGWFDLPAMKYTAMVNGYTALAMTKLDILDKLDEIKIGVSYMKNGLKMEHYPSSVKQFEGIKVFLT